MVSKHYCVEIRPPFAQWVLEIRLQPRIFLSHVRKEARRRHPFIARNKSYSRFLYAERVIKTCKPLKGLHCGMDCGGRVVRKSRALALDPDQLSSVLHGRSSLTRYTRIPVQRLLNSFRMMEFKQHLSKAKHRYSSTM
jgi:hypothetical protein